MTYEDYASLPEDKSVLYELVAGRLEAMSPGASVQHQMIGSYLHHPLMHGCESECIILYKVDVILSPYDDPTRGGRPPGSHRGNSVPVDG